MPNPRFRHSTHLRSKTFDDPPGRETSDCRVVEFQRSSIHISNAAFLLSFKRKERCRSVSQRPKTENRKTHSPTRTTGPFTRIINDIIIVYS